MSVLGNNLLAEYYAQNQGLPFGYEAVEYLESTGTQYIDTRVHLGNNTGYKIEASINKDSEGAGTFILFGSRSSLTINSRNWLNASSSKNKTVSIGWGEFLNLGLKLLNNKIYIFNVNYKNSRKAIVENTQINLSDNLATHTISAYLFAANNFNGADYFCKAKLYHAIITVNTTFLCNYVPCVRKSDNKPGLYDLCRSICPLTGTPFYINAGTGEFVTP